MSDFLAKLIAEGKDLIGEVKVPVREDSVSMDRFDLRDFEELRDNVPAIKRIEVDMGRKHDYVAQFMQDLFGLLFKAVPNITPSDEMKPSHQGLNAVIVEIGDMAEFMALRQHAQGDNYGSAMAMISMKDVIEEALGQAQRLTEEAAGEQQAAQDALDQLGQEIQDLIDLLGMGPMTDPNGPPSKAQGELQAKLDQFAGDRQKLQQLAQATADGAAQAAAGMKAALRAKAAETTADLDEEQALASAFGVEDGELKKMPFEERAKLAQRLKNNRLASFLKLLGQFKMVQQAESRKRVINAATEVHGVTFSDNLERLTAGEYLNLASPELETLFWLRYTEQQLLTYDVRGIERLGQGPIICVVDESGSMGTPDVAGGTREAWSKALALAMLDQARHRNRDFIYIGFSSSGQQITLRFPKGTNVLTQVLEMTEHFWGGGTNYERPLTLALDIVQEYADQDLPKPDIVFMSDDAYGAMDEEFMHRWNGLKDKTSLQCYGIAIGCSYSGAMEQISDNVREITELASDPRVMADVFRTI
jgi:uncharacterized protein with von Willebrand factor type A (vWA) domain